MRRIRVSAGFHQGCYLLLLTLIFHVFPFSVVMCSDNTDNCQEDLLRGIAFYESNRFEIARDVFQEAIEKLSPKTECRKELAESYLFLGKCYILFDDIDLGKESFSRALNLNPNLNLTIDTDPKKIVKPFQEVLKSREEETMGKPWYKKWWVWALAGGVVVGAIASSSTSSGDVSDDPGNVTVRWGP